MRGISILIITLFFTFQVYGQFIYVSSLDDEILRLDIENCTYEHLATVDFQVYDISFHPNGNLYGFSSEGFLYKINISTGESNFIYGFSEGFSNNFNSLTIGADGVIYAMGEQGSLFSYNLTTQAEINHGYTGYSATGDLTFYNGNLYAAVKGNKIIQIDINNPSNSKVAIDKDINGAIYGIVSSGDNCNTITTYGISSDADLGRDNSSIYQLDFSSNSMDLVCELDISVGGGASTFEFLASAPVIAQKIEKVNPDCGLENGSISMEGSGGTGQLSYSIDNINFQSSGDFDNLSEGIYDIAIKDENDCIYSEEVELSFINVLEISNVISENATCGKSDGAISIEAQGGKGQLQISLNDGNFQSNFTFENLASGSFNAVITDEVGCEIDTMIRVNTESCPIHIPNAFTPNNDGVNDVFRVYPSQDFVGDFRTMKIIDRWGKLVYETQNFDPENAGWNGRYKEQELGIGVYIYLIEVVPDYGESVILEGNVTLVK